MLERVFERKEWKFFAVLPRAAPGLALAWWLALLLRGGLPAAFAVAMGVLVGAVERGNPLAGPLALAGAIFILLQVLSPIHQAVSANLGDRTAAWLYDRLTEACVRPPGMAHLEDAKLASDLTVARDFDLGMTGPPLTISMDFIAGGMAEMVGGIACALILLRYAWWAPILLAGAWAATHWLLRESAVWRDRNTEEVRSAQRDADYAYRLAVDPPASKRSEEHTSELQSRLHLVCRLLLEKKKKNIHTSSSSDDTSKRHLCAPAPCKLMPLRCYKSDPAKFSTSSRSMSISLGQ